MSNRKSAPTTAREPIEIARLKFVDDRQEGAGIHLASSCVSAVVDRRRRHRIKYLPWLRAFRVEFYDAQGADGKILEAVQIPESRVLWWSMTADQNASDLSGS